MIHVTIGVIIHVTKYIIHNDIIIIIIIQVLCIYNDSANTYIIIIMYTTLRL